MIQGWLQLFKFLEALALKLATKIHPCQSNVFCVEHCHKKIIFVNCNDILENRKIYLPRKRLVAMDMQSFLFFSPRVWGSQTPSLFTFPTFFRWWNGMCWCQVLILEYFFSPILKHLDRGLMSVLPGFISQWCITRKKFWNPVSH